MLFYFFIIVLKKIITALWLWLIRLTWLVILKRIKNNIHRVYFAHIVIRITYPETSENYWIDLTLQALYMCQLYTVFVHQNSNQNPIEIAGKPKK